MNTSPLSARALWLIALFVALSALSLDLRNLSARESAPETAAARVASAKPEATAPAPAVPAPLLAPAAVPVDDARPRRVLFLGTEASCTRNMPLMITALAKTANQARPFAPFHAERRSRRYEDEIASGDAERDIAAGGPWEAVVLQDTSGYAYWGPDGRERWFPHARVLHRAIANAGAKAVLFVPVASNIISIDEEGRFKDAEYEKKQTNIIENYAALAHELGVDQVPIGKAYGALRNAWPRERLHEIGGHIATRAGDYLTACALYAYFYRQSPVGNAYTAGVEPELARAIQEAVALVMTAAR